MSQSTLNFLIGRIRFYLTFLSKLLFIRSDKWNANSFVKEGVFDLFSKLLSDITNRKASVKLKLTAINSSSTCYAAKLIF